MSVKIRLARRGRKKLSLFDIVIADARAPRDGRFIQKIGTYNPNTNPASISLNQDQALDWILKGAQPTDTVRAILSYKGIMYKKHLQVGVIKGAITQEQADKKFEAWLKDKESKIEAKVKSINDKKASDRKAQLEVESKVSSSRAEGIAARKAAADAEVVEEVLDAIQEADEEAAGVEVETAAEVATEEAVAEAVPEEPAAEVATEEPAAEVTTEEPAPEVAPEEPAADETTEEEKA